MPITILRATSPANLGDNVPSTYQSVRLSPFGTPANPAGGDIECVATVLADLPSSVIIASVRFRAICWSPEITPTPPFSSLRMGWRVGGNSAIAAATRDTTDGVNVVCRDADGVDPGDVVGAAYYISTAQITTQPNGLAWDNAAVNALAEVKVLYAYAADTDPWWGGNGQFVDLDVGEIWAEVTTQSRSDLIAEVGAVVVTGELSPAVQRRIEIGARAARGELSPPAKARVDLGGRAAHGELSPPVEARVELGAAAARGELSPAVQARVELGAKAVRGELSPPVKTRVDIGALVVSGDIEGV